MDLEGHVNSDTTDPDHLGPSASFKPGGQAENLAGSGMPWILAHAV